MLAKVVVSEWVAVYSWILVLLAHGVLLTQEDDGEGDRKEDEDNSKGDKLLNPSFCLSVIPILPNDIRRFRCLFDFNLLTKESSPLCKFFFFDTIVILECSVVAFFRLESDKDSTRSLKLIKKDRIFLEVHSDCFIYLIKFIPVFEFDGSSSLFQPVDDLSVIESAGHNCNLDSVSVVFRIIDA